MNGALGQHVLMNFVEVKLEETGPVNTPSMEVSPAVMVTLKKRRHVLCRYVHQVCMF